MVEDKEKVCLYPLSSLSSTAILGGNEEEVFMVFKGNFIFLNMFCSVERMEEKRFPNTHDGASMTLGEWIVNYNYICGSFQTYMACSCFNNVICCEPHVKRS